MDFGTLGIFCGHGTVYDTDVAVDDSYLLHTIAVVASGPLADVDAFNQPGVEAYKRIMGPKLQEVKNK